MRRCPWVRNELDQRYHDTEWGVPCYDDRVLFEFLILGGAQAGLSWATILAKRENYRNALHGFDPVRIARYTSRDSERLLGDPGIVRNRLKIAATIVNAQACLRVQAEYAGRGGLAGYLWQFVDGRPVTNRCRMLAEVPTRSAVSDVLSKDLKRRGFKFVGSTICYAFMQAVGMVNDHLVECFRHAEVQSAGDPAPGRARFRSVDSRRPEEPA